MRNKFKRLSCVLLAMLCMTSFSIPAFAYASEVETTEPTVATAGISLIQTDTENSDAETGEDQPYSFSIAEDGSIVITINGIEWTYDVGDDEETTTGKVVTQGSRLNVRTGAGMSYQIIDQLRPGEEVTVIGVEGDWYKVTIPEKTGYVHSDYLELYETAEENNEMDLATLVLLMNLFAQNPDTEQSALTPDGNLSLIDDILQTEYVGDDDDELQQKQFITVQSKNGNYFYLVIDRSGETENVYFMNLVDEADLMALTETDKEVAACSCRDKCAVGAINSSCEICRTNMTECVGKEAEPEPEPTEPVEEEPEKEYSGTGGLIVILLIIAAAGGGAVYWFKFRKKKPKTSGDSDLDDYDFGEADEEDEEYELDDSDVMEEADSDDEDK